jgi:uncharacterized protein
VKKIVIRDSNIHGRGVFAEQNIDVGEVIIDWDGCTELLTGQEMAVVPPDERKYLSLIDSQYVLFKPPARFVNHSCNPNARGEKGHDVAIRHILRGEEVTVDYVAEQVPDLNLQCKCGANGCRGLLKVGPQN